jgi:HlyD family secretion protein
MPLTAVTTNEPEAQPTVPLTAMDRAIERHWLSRERLGIALLLVSLVGLTIFGYIRYGLQRTAAVASERITISEVGFGRFREYIPVTGNIVPRTTIYLDAVEGGQVTAVRAEAGQLVEAGDALVTLKNTNLQLEVIGREAQLTEQLNNLSTTSLAFEQNRLRHRRELIDIDYQIDRLERQLSRKRPLLASGGTTQSELDDLEAELSYQQTLRVAVEDAQRIDAESQATQIETLREAISAMNRNLSIARENLDNLVVTAPISGQLTVFDANVGESKAPGERVGQIDELGAFKISAFVDEFYLTRVTIGQVATVEIDGETRGLEVGKIYPDVRNRQFEVELTFTASAPPGIRRGQTVRMRLEIGQPADTLIVPNGTFFEDTGGGWVFVVDSAGEHAKRRDVRFGRRNPDGIEIVEGLREGERVITSSYASFLDVDRLQFRDERR